MTDKAMSYMEALGTLQQVIKLVTPEDVADAINDQFDPIKVIEIQDMLFAHRQFVLEAALKEAKEREAIERKPAAKSASGKSPVAPPQKKGGRK